MASQGTLFVAFYLCMILPAISPADANYQVGSPCSCTLRGHVYNLGPLASSDGYPKFDKDVKGWNFAYNPCIPFTVNEPECKDVAVCRWDNRGRTYTNLGKQSGVECQYEDGEEELVFQVPNSPNEQTRIRLKCNKDLKGVLDARFDVIDDDYPNTILQVEHNCCCPDACPLGQPLPSKKGVDYWVAVGFAGFFVLCTIVLALVLVYVCRRWQRPRGQERQLLLEQAGRPGENG